MIAIMDEQIKVNYMTEQSVKARLGEVADAWGDMSRVTTHAIVAFLLLEPWERAVWAEFYELAKARAKTRGTTTWDEIVKIRTQYAEEFQRRPETPVATPKGLSQSEFEEELRKAIHRPRPPEPGHPANPPKKPKK